MNDSVNQQRTRPTLSPAQIERAVSTLSDADLIRLRLAANYYSQPAIAADDLLQEAICRSLEGRRRCPTNVDLVVFLSQTMRSIASEERQKDKRLGVSVPTEAEDGGESAYAVSPAVEETAIGEEEAARIRGGIVSLFADDEKARDLVEGVMEEFTREELRELTDLDETAYETKRKLIRRRIQRAYPKGWMR